MKMPFTKRGKASSYSQEEKQKNECSFCKGKKQFSIFCGDTVFYFDFRGINFFQNRAERLVTIRSKILSIWVSAMLRSDVSLNLHSKISDGSLMRIVLSKCVTIRKWCAFLVPIPMCKCERYFRVY